MIAAAKFEGKTLVLTFKGGSASAGLSEVEEVIIEAADGELQERITRRFVGNFVRALPWQDSLQKVNRHGPPIHIPWIAHRDPPIPKYQAPNNF